MMKIHSISSFKDPSQGKNFMENWMQTVQQQNGTYYEKIVVKSMLGETVVWSMNREHKNMKTLVIFPGFRTCSLFWDFDNGLSELKKKYRIFLVDTNGQPSLSEGKTPKIRSDEYGIWAADLLRQLSIDKAVVAGASFGGLVCLKLGKVAPEKVEKILLLNPGCLAPFSLSFKNLYYNMLPIFFPSEKNVTTFLNEAVFYKDHHTLKGVSKKLIIDYELFVLQNYIDKAEKPYAMKAEELQRITSEVYLLLGEKDRLFPFEKSKAIAEKHLRNLRKVYVLKETGHGIETSPEAMAIVKELMEV